MQNETMRTTLAIDDDVLSRVKDVAEARGASLGVVVSDLLRRSLELGETETDGFPIFKVPKGARRITRAAVERALDE